MEITYDAAKNEKNIRERSLDFEFAREFDFDTAMIKQVVRKGELRWTALGYYEGLIHMLCFIHIAGGIRVISFRRAHRKERAEYADEKRVDR